MSTKKEIKCDRCGQLWLKTEIDLTDTCDTCYENKRHLRGPCSFGNSIEDYPDRDNICKPPKDICVQCYRAGKTCEGCGATGVETVLDYDRYRKCAKCFVPATTAKS